MPELTEAAEENTVSKLTVKYQFEKKEWTRNGLYPEHPLSEVV